MSNGMFRALSILINFNYYELEKIPGVILIDDIGEGLDFERSTKLIELLISKAEMNENIQIVMSTNDTFVMDNVELKYWQIIDRVGGEVKYYNHSNSQERFEDYKFTGLNHFDFFATGFFKNGFSKDN
jgi:AAA15 family ATPase/GTPase